MTPVQTVTFAALWCMVALLGILVLTIFRQIDRLYGDDSASERSLSRDSKTPPIEVLKGEDTEVLTFESDGRVRLISFLSPGCSECENVLPGLVKLAERGSEIHVVVGGSGWSEYANLAVPNMNIWWSAHPPDAIRDYGAERVPLSYVVLGSVIQESTRSDDADEIASLMKLSFVGSSSPGGGIGK